MDGHDYQPHSKPAAEQSPSRHLDLGCGAIPRNPFNADQVFGLDILNRVDSRKDNIHFVTANLVFEGIPFPDSHFDSVSAYDFLEHIPRLIYIEGRTDLAFVRLMSEIHRVLKSNGQFYSTTPCYPKESAFVDPTHVNFISKNTHKYFTAPHLWARMYGFTGNFEVLRAKLVNFDAEVNKRNALKTFLRHLLVALHPNARQHIVWHFKALK
jgi:SAM-dependent methyltransferase